MENYHAIIDRIMKLDEDAPGIMWLTMNLLEELQLEIDNLKNIECHPMEKALVESLLRIVHVKIDRRISHISTTYLRLKK